MSNYYDTAVYCNKFTKNNKKSNKKNYKLQLEVSDKNVNQKITIQQS